MQMARARITYADDVLPEIERGRVIVHGRKVSIMEWVPNDGYYETVDTMNDATVTDGGKTVTIAGTSQRAVGQMQLSPADAQVVVTAQRLGKKCCGQ